MEDSNPILWFGWFRPDILVEYKQLFWQGALVTVGTTVVCVLMGCALGLLLALARLAETRHQPWRAVCQYLLRWPSTAYVSFFRGTPLFVQMSDRFHGIFVALSSIVSAKSSDSW